MLIKPLCNAISTSAPLSSKWTSEPWLITMDKPIETMPKLRIYKAKLAAQITKSLGWCPLWYNSSIPKMARMSVGKHTIQKASLVYRGFSREVRRENMVRWVRWILWILGLYITHVICNYICIYIIQPIKTGTKLLNSHGIIQVIIKTNLKPTNGSLEACMMDQRSLNFGEILTVVYRISGVFPCKRRAWIARLRHPKHLRKRLADPTFSLADPNIHSYSLQ